MAPTAQLEDALEAFSRGDLARAQAVAEAAVETEPSAQWHHLLGLIHCRRGDPSAGVEWLRRACDAEPANIGFQVIAARALIDAGRAADVLAAPEPAPISSAATVALWQARGEAADQAGDGIASERAWRTVAAAAPRDWRAWANLGDALARLDRWPAAVDALANALALHSSDAHLERRFAAAVRGLAMVLERSNRMDLLRELLEGAQQQGVGPGRLGYPLALLALRDGDAGRARELLLAEDPRIDPVRWHALMARIAEESGDAATAFAEAEAMHAAVPDPAGWRRRAADYRCKIERFAGTVTAEWVSTLNPLDPAAAPSAPAFLVGFPRSGTTLLDSFLRGHPDTQVVEEQPMLNAAEAVIGDFAELPARSPHQLEQARRAYFAELDRHVEPGFEGRVIDKLPLNMLGLPIVYNLFPDARVIFAQRHPCDVVLSCFLQAFTQNDAMACFLDLEDAAGLYDAAMRLFWSSRELLPLKFHTLVYEELIADPESALRSAVEFLGLDWRPELLDHQATALARGAINTPSYAQVVRPLTQAPAGRWRRYREQLEPVLPVLLPWAERLGYPA